VEGCPLDAPDGNGHRHAEDSAHARGLSPGPPVRETSAQRGKHLTIPEAFSTNHFSAVNAALRVLKVWLSTAEARVRLPEKRAPTRPPLFLPITIPSRWRSAAIKSAQAPLFSIAGRESVKRATHSPSVAGSFCHRTSRRGHPCQRLLKVPD
jgi:hypothetical protein